MEAAPPVIPDDLVEEILLRLPPDDPACLLRASIVCKDWGGIVSRPAFRRRLHELHRTPPVLGFLHGCGDDLIPHFIPNTASSFSPAAPDWHRWRAQDCRHGRALFFSTGEGTLELLVWEPTTGAQQRVPVPGAFGSWNDDPMAAVLCAADGCDHRDCLGGPFRVVFSFSDVPEDFDEEDEWVRSLTVYSSETGTWGELTSAHSEFDINYQEYSSLLVGSSLLYFRGMPEYSTITEYDMARHALTVFEPPGACSKHGRTLMLTEDGGLGVIEEGLFNQHVKLWTREASDGTDARWVLSREICLDNLLPVDARSDARYARASVVRFAEGANVILVSTVAGLFTIELQSEQVRKVCNCRDSSDFIPVVCFYTPVPRGEHQNLLALKPSEEAGGGEAHLLFDKGSNAIKEEDFVNTFESISHGHNMRVPCYGEVALEGASTLNIYGCTLLPKAAPNEESVMGTSSKEDAGNSTTSGSNVECAPPSEKGDS